MSKPIQGKVFPNSTEPALVGERANPFPSALLKAAAIDELQLVEPPGRKDYVGDFNATYAHMVMNPPKELNPFDPIVMGNIGAEIAKRVEERLREEITKTVIGDGFIRTASIPTQAIPDNMEPLTFEKLADIEADLNLKPTSEQWRRLNAWLYASRYGSDIRIKPERSIVSLDIA